MQSFAENCSIHGFKFIFGNEHSKFAKIFWTLMVLLSFCVFTFYLHEIQIKWLHSPEFVQISRVVELNKFPFPAITICLPTFSRNATLNYTQTSYHLGSHKFSPDECKILIANLHWCNTAELTRKKFFCDRNIDLKIVEIMKNTSFNTEEIFFQCTDESNSKNSTEVFCTKKLVKFLADFGFCFTFNMQSFDTIFNKDAIHEDFKYDSDNQEKSTWTSEKGYEDGKLKFPKRAQNEAYVSFNLHLGNEYQQNYCDSNEEYSVIVHLPNEIPTRNHEVHNFKVNESFIYNIDVESYQANKELRRFSPDLRKCYFEDERKLFYFKTYTKALCELECQSNWTLKHCGCVKFSMPRNKSMKVCRTTDEIECFVNYVPEYSLTSMIPCDCYEPCNEIVYDASKLSVGDVKPTFIAEKKGTHRFAEILFIFPNGSLVLETEKLASYRLQNLIAEIGGLLGFCLGCSLLSVIEMFYTIFGICSPKVLNVSEPNEIEEYNKLILKIEKETEGIRKRIKKIEKSQNIYVNNLNELVL